MNDITQILSKMWERPSARVLPLGSRAMSETWRVEFTDGRLPRLAVLKRLPEHGDGVEHLARLRLVRYLRDRKVSELAVIPTVPQTDAAVADDGRVYTLYEWVEGEDFNPLHPRAFMEGGTFLGEFHRAVAPLSGWKYPTPTFSIAAEWREEIARRAQDLVETDCPTEWLERLDKSLGEALPLSQGLPMSILHNDFRAQNIRFRRGRSRALLDLDQSVYGTRLADLSYALVFYASVYRANPMSEEQVAEFFAAYLEQVPLEMEEIEALRSWLHLALWRGVSLWLHLRYVRQFPIRLLSWARMFGEDTSWLDGYTERLTALAQ